MNQNDIHNKAVGDWQRLVKAHIEFCQAMTEFFSNKDAAVDCLRRSLRGNDRMTAIAMVKKLRPDDILLLFNELVFLASFSHGSIQSVRDIILSLPRDWVLSNIESSVEPLLSNGTYDEYRRFLELYSQLDRNLTLKLARRAFEYSDEDIREAGEEYLESLSEIRGKSQE
jgi:hypothetical protein